MPTAETAVTTNMLCNGVGVRAVFPVSSIVTIGDVVGVQGDLAYTSSGPCIRVTRWGVLTPTRSSSLFSRAAVRNDGAIREIAFLRDRHLRNSVAMRARVIHTIREFLDARGFLEVETPIILPTRDIAPVEHFSVSPSATGQQVLRICPENCLKRLVVAGFDRVYEIGRSFRVEEESSERLCQFTTMECYQAFASYEDAADLCHELVVAVTKSVKHGDTHVDVGGQTFDLAQPWQRLDFRTAVLHHSGIDVDQYPDYDSLVRAMTAGRISAQDLRSHRECLNRLAECVEQSVVAPTILMDHPAETICVAKRHAESTRSNCIERFELFIGGCEIAHAFSELTDPVEQRERMEILLDEKVRNGDARHSLDENFLSALDVGLPPTAGLGIGIDRLIMLLTGEPINRVVTFS